MKISEVRDGGIYATKVGDQLVRVRVAAQRQMRGQNLATLFRCTRLDTKQTLPKLRDARALREVT